MKEPGVVAHTRWQECLHRPVPGVFKFDCSVLATFDSEDLCACEAHAAEMGVFADADIADGPTGPVYCACIGAMCGCGRPKRPVSSARPLTFDEANPRPGKCGTCKHAESRECMQLFLGRLNAGGPKCVCACHPVEAKRAPKVVGRYDDTCSFEYVVAARAGCSTSDEAKLVYDNAYAWGAEHAGAATGIDSERVKRPVGKVRPEYLEEIDVDFVGLLDVGVRR